ncbi:MAG TPA: DUF1553 domain-containing protein, partial [Armatimonadota bacterium]|nr:DUF1553 domain-containing protein [Armatimonadota bacterium]
AITSKQNPLTARVMVNRVWIGHFGTGLVRTPSDFGLRSDPPTNPELLDYLASRFMEDGWSLKKLHRLIMLSSTYQQTSDENPRSAKVDPENALLWRQNRRRLDLESMRDSLLWASGELDPKVGGPAVDIIGQPFTVRRTVYGFIDRQNLPNLFRAFDFASPDSSSPQRFHTTVPQQALFLMNSPFVVEQARHLASRPEVAGQSSPEGKITAMYRIAYQRDPAPDEIALALRYLRGAETGAPETAQSAPLWQFGYGEVDDGVGRVKSFQALPHFTGSAWQGGPQLPDPKLGWVILTAQGGHPGADRQHLAIRRWTAPRDGTVTIAGTLGHPVQAGDGVRARVISSRTGIAGSWTAHHSSTQTPVERLEVKRGDTLDFVVDCRQSIDNDGFTWAPTVRMLEQGAAGQEWSAVAGFHGPAGQNKALTPWEKYAQVLLMSNEFMFVD